MSLKVESMKILIATNKNETFKNKFQHWVGLLESEKMDMFSDLNEFLEENELRQNIVRQYILNHLPRSYSNDKCFPENTDPQKCD